MCLKFVLNNLKLMYQDLNKKNFKLSVESCIKNKVQPSFAVL